MTIPTIILKRLNQSGYVDMSVEQEGNRPPKQVYSITQLGQLKFLELLKVALTHVQDVTPAGDIGIMFIDHLSHVDALSCLKDRLQKAEDLLKPYEFVPKHGHGAGIDLSIQHRQLLLSTERDWLKQVIEQYATADIHG